jgi:site-specific DNA recombinase
MATVQAIIYAAKSTEDKHGSIPTQLADCRRMAEGEDWKVAGEFQDEGFSAYSGNRGPGLEKAKALAVKTAAENGEAVLIVQHSDRLARGAGDTPDAADHLVEVLTWANRHRVTLRTVQDDFLADPRMALLMAAVQGQRNTEDSRRKSESVKAGMKRRAERGMFSGPRPYGYEYAKDKSGLLIVPHEAEIVRRIWAEFAAGQATTAIARHLEADGLPTMKGGPWRQGTVNGIVRNLVYTGVVPYRGEYLPGVHEPIIDEGTAEKVASLLTARPKAKRGRPHKGRHLFRGGLLRCECGGPMVPRTNGGYELYYCDNRWKREPGFCNMKTVRRAVVDNAVFNYFERVGLDLEATRKQLGDEHGRKADEARELLTDAGRRERAAEDALKRVRRAFQEGKIEADDWADQRPELSEDFETAKAETTQRRQALGEIEQDDLLADAEQETLERLADIRRAIAGEIEDAEGVEAVRAALTRLFERFTLHPRDGASYGPQRRGEASEGPDRAPVLDAADLSIELWIRDSVLEGYEGLFQPVLAREGLSVQKTREGSPCR